MVFEQTRVETKINDDRNRTKVHIEHRHRLPVPVCVPFYGKYLKRTNGGSAISSAIVSHVHRGNSVVVLVSAHKIYNKRDRPTLKMKATTTHMCTIADRCDISKIGPADCYCVFKISRNLCSYLCKQPTRNMTTPFEAPLWHTRSHHSHTQKSVRKQITLCDCDASGSDRDGSCHFSGGDAEKRCTVLERSAQEKKTI